MELTQTFPVTGNVQSGRIENFLSDFSVRKTNLTSVPLTAKSFQVNNVSASISAKNGNAAKDADMPKPDAAKTPKKKLTSRAAEDLKLIESAIGGCQKSYDKLFNRYRYSVYGKMYGMVKNHEDAEDLTHEAFGKAFHKLPSYVPNYAFSTWLHRIAKNNCIDHIRKKKLNTLSIDEPVEKDSACDFSNNLKAKALNPEEKMVREQRLQLVRGSVSQLTEKYRRMIVLRYFEEKSYDEIAEKLGMPLGTVKAQLFRAKDLMFELIMESGAASYIEDTRRRKGTKKAVA